jgi:hypothetical protein
LKHIFLFSFLQVYCDGYIFPRLRELFYNPSKFSMDNAWTSKPTCAYKTMEIPTSNKHRNEWVLKRRN